MPTSVPSAAFSLLNLPTSSSSLRSRLSWICWRLARILLLLDAPLAQRSASPRLLSGGTPAGSDCSPGTPRCSPENKHWMRSGLVVKASDCQCTNCNGPGQCCGSGMFIPDPGSWFLPIPDPGSKNSNKRERWKKISCHTFLCSHKFHKIVNYFSFEVLKKKIRANFQRIIILFTQKIVKKLLKIWSWDPGYEIRDPEKTYSGSRIPDPGVKKHPIPDPGSGSATLVLGSIPASVAQWNLRGGRWSSVEYSI